MSEYTRPPRAADLEAEISALPTCEGGRQRPFFSGYRANHDFHLPGEINDAQHEYLDGGKLEPGQTGKALLWLLGPERQKGRLYPGFEFTVQEGARLIGRGKITQVLNAELRKDI